MKFKAYLIVLLSLFFILTGCSSSSEVEATESQESSASTTESTGENAYTRTESTIKNDTKTGSVITTQQSFQLDTIITLSIYDDKEAPNDIFTSLFEEIAYYENMLSKSIEASELSKVNKNAGIAPVVISDEFMDLMIKGIGYGKASEGLFDITIGPVVTLWGIGTDHAAVPAEDVLKSQMALVDYKKIVIDETEKSVYLPEVGMALDLGAIAKGYIADRIKDLVLESGYDSAIINLGGNVLTVGVKPNGANWSIGVRNPEIDAVTELGALSVQDLSVVSSGVYERFFMEGDIRYHHIINPFTGYSEQNELMSVSIVSKESVDGDALSTTVFLLGLEKGYDYIESLEGIEAIFILNDRSVYITSGLVENFSILDTDFQIKSLKP